MQFPQRKQIRLDRDCYETEGIIYHIIIRTAGARKLFHEPTVAADIFNGIMTGKIAQESDLYAVCLMPNHVHLLLGIKHVNLIDLIKGWKAFTTNHLHQSGINGDIWQRSFYDHAMRYEENLLATAKYILENPVRAGVVPESSAYPYTWHKWM
ncbi:MAG: REP-associated tyrosine transposase [Armatimonadota bacterium]